MFEDVYDAFDALADEPGTETDEEQTIEIAIVAGESSQASAIIEPDLPDEALAMLFEVDPRDSQGRPLRYDHERKRWYEPPDDAEG